MCDLHVVALHYTATPSNTASFDDAPPIGAHIDGFAFRLYEGGLTLTPSSHLAATAVDLFADPDLLARVKSEFAAM